MDINQSQYQYQQSQLHNNNSNRNIMNNMNNNFRSNSNSNSNNNNNNNRNNANLNINQSQLQFHESEAETETENIPMNDHKSADSDTIDIMAISKVVSGQLTILASQIEDERQKNRIERQTLAKEKAQIRIERQQMEHQRRQLTILASQIEDERQQIGIERQQMEHQRRAFEMRVTELEREKAELAMPISHDCQFDNHCTKSYLTAAALLTHVECFHLRLKRWKCGACDYKSHYYKIEIQKHLKLKHGIIAGKAHPHLIKL